jgi:hypothetical protein
MNLNNFIFVDKNWSNDCSIHFKSPSNLVELIEIKIKLEKEVKECEGAFQWDEVIVDSCSHLMCQFSN